MATQRLDRAFAILPVLLVAGCRRGGGGAVDSASECPASWLEPPAVDPSIAVPSGSATVLFHAAAVGSQIYLCRPPADNPSGPAAWSVARPEASLFDCKGAVIGRHFLNDNMGLPEWQLTDGAYVVAHKGASWGGGVAGAWLVRVAEGTLPYDAGAIAYPPADGRRERFGETRYVQRVHTTGGLPPPADACKRFGLDRREIPYTADYYFYGP
jgi:hypothetical protein